MRKAELDSAVRKAELRYRGPAYTPRSVLVTLLLLAAVTLYMALALPEYTIYQYNQFMLFAIVAIALNLLMGTAGQVSLGSAGFLAAGAFGSVFLLDAGLPFPADVIIAGLVGAVIGLIVGMPSLRLKGIYLALATLAAHFTILWAAQRYQTAKAGPAGFIITPLFSEAGSLMQQVYWAVLLFALLAVTMIVFARLSRHRTGRAWRMVRDHEAAAPALGIQVTRYKLLAFVVSSGVTSACGGLLLHFTGAAAVETFTLDMAILIAAMIVVGGMDSVVGAVIGAAILTALPQVIPDLLGPLLPKDRRATDGPHLAAVVYGVLIVILVTRSPGGVAGWLRSRAELWAPKVRRRWTSLVGR